MKKTLVLVALLVLASLSYASACSCMRPGSPTEEMKKSDAVFAGKVIKIDLPVSEDGTYGAGSAKVTLDVSQVWKGIKSKTITVSTATNSAACGFLCDSPDCTAGFNIGGEYIVYASDYNSDGELSTNICTRTRMRSEAQEDLAGLGNGTIITSTLLTGEAIPPIICIQEGEYAGPPNKCCEGLNIVGIFAPNSITKGDCSVMATLPGGDCVRCGDSVCGLGENICNCASDCRSSTNGNKGDGLFTIGLIAGLLILSVAIAYTVYYKKSKTKKAKK